MREPGLLRFDSDRFMEELAERLQAQARPDLRDLVAQWESHREPLPGDENTPQVPSTLKLYQPAHGRFYLVAASLVCRLPGLPDHVVDTAKGERASFVLRRYLDLGDGYRAEAAWVLDPTDERKQRRMWKQLDPMDLLNGGLAPTEELLPMFPVNFTVEGKRRRMLVGLVPTSSRDTFVSASAFDPGSESTDLLRTEAESMVLGPLEDLLALKPPLASPNASDTHQTLAEGLSRFLLLDFATLLRQRLLPLWNALEGTGPVPAVGTSLRPLYDLLKTARVGPVGSGYTDWLWSHALVTAWNLRTAITSGQQPGGLLVNLRRTNLTPGDLRQKLFQALQSATYTPPAQPFPVPKLEQPGTAEYFIRCVYQRPQCKPPHPPLVSEPSPLFTLAGFFDADAPGRPIRIELPVDTSIAGLRRFKKNVGFTLSKQLRNQMSRVIDLEKTMDGEVAEGKNFTFGELCMFSIPIITLCALIVLMIFLSLLNIIFWWLPFLKICLPKPR
jgi:hypothetical protein